MRIMQLIHSEKISGVYSICNGIFSNWAEKENMFLFVLRVRNHELKVQGNKYINNGQNFIQDLRNLRNYINSNKISIVHCHAIWQGLFLLFILRFSRQVKVKVVFHQHALFKRGVEYDFKSYYMTKILLPFVDKCIAASDSTKEYLLKNSSIHHDQISVVNNFVSPSNSGEKLTTDSDLLKLNKNDFKVGFAGRIVPTKDWRTFVDSYSHLSAKLKDNISYYIAGAGYEQKLLRSYLDSNSDLKVYFLGPIDNMQDFYNNMDLFVSCSHQESFGLTVAEAQMSGVLVISSDIEGISSIITDGVNGLLFKTGDSENLTTKVEIVYRDKELRERLARNGKESALRFDRTKYLSRLSEIYLGLSR